MSRRRVLLAAHFLPVIPCQLVVNGNFITTASWTRSTYVTTRVEDGTMTVGTRLGSNRDYAITQSVPIVRGHKYLFAGILTTLTGTASKYFKVYVGSITLLYEDYVPSGKVYRSLYFFDNAEEDGAVTIRIAMGKAAPEAMDLFTVKNIQLFDLTEMYGEGNEPTSVEEMTGFVLPDRYYE